jgi:hypothetical protein
MAKMGCGYGSECHLLRFLGRHRQELNRRVLEAVGSERIEWLDFGFQPKGRWQDAEITGLDFLPEGHAARTEWRDWWPRGHGNRGVHTWDAVGQVRVNGTDEWLLVEAKANLEELQPDCGAKSPRSVATIERAFAETRRALGVPEDRDWCHGYYQLCNRLAALSFLNSHDVPARLLLIYFVGDRGDAGRTCPADEGEWQHALRAQAEHVGLPEAHPLADRIHQLFLPVVL